MKKLIFVLLRGLKWLALGVAGLVVVVLGCWLLLPDEDLNPEARQILEAQPTVPPEQNAYYALWGLTASPELDAFATGRKIVEMQVAAVRAQGYWAKVDHLPLLGATPLGPRERSAVLCRPQGEVAHCLSVLRQHRAELLADMAAKDVYIRRYRALRTYPRWESTMTPTSATPMLDWQAVIYMAELVDAAIAFDMESSAKQAAALADLRSEIALWRRVGRDADVVIDRVVPAAILYRKYRLLSELLAEYPALVNEHRDLIAQMSNPLTGADTDLRRALHGEFRTGAGLFQWKDQEGMPAVFSHPVSERVTEGGRWSARLFFRANATTNLVFQRYQSQGKFFAQSAQDIVANGKEFRDKQPSSYHIRDPRTWLYNHIGRILADVSGPFADAYSYRLHDLVGYTRLIELQRQLLAARTPPDKIPAFLAGVDAALRNPYTGQPMSYDSATHSISFMPKSPNYAKKGAPVAVALAR